MSYIKISDSEIDKDIKMFQKIMKEMIKEIDEEKGDTYTFYDNEGKKRVLPKEVVKKQICEVIKEETLNYIIKDNRRILDDEKEYHNSNKVIK